MGSKQNHRRTMKNVVMKAAVLHFALLMTVSNTYADGRLIDGYGNNADNPKWGSAGSRLLRHSLAAYGDGIKEPRGDDWPNPRKISNIVSAQTESIPNRVRATDFVWQWGQFVDHDIDLTVQAAPNEPMPISVPPGDPHFDPEGTGGVTIPLSRSEYDPSSGTGQGNPREQINAVTSFIDASNVYGSDDDRAAALRKNDGTGRLKTSAGNLLPFNTEGLPNAPSSLARNFFLAGDIRANEHVGLTSLHTLFVREHNRLARRLAWKHPRLSGDAIYNRARAYVGAQMQVITYKEFLPVLLGRKALSRYKGYRTLVNPSVSNEFSTIAYRVGHTMLSSKIRRLRRNGRPIKNGHLALRDGFFSPHRIIKEGGIAPILRGLANQRMQDVDPFVIDDVRNFLFGPPGSGGFDLVSLNIQRGRDHGLPDYNQMRRAYDLEPVTSFSEITSNPGLRKKLGEAYANVDEVDPWIGGLAEDHVPGALVGELFHTILKDQFERLRNGDWFWYENRKNGLFSRRQIRRLNRTKLAKIIRRNTRHLGKMQRNVFRLPKTRSRPR